MGKVKIENRRGWLLSDKEIDIIVQGVTTLLDNYLLTEQDTIVAQRLLGEMCDVIAWADVE